ncbi:MAG: cation diffusion facilitator family transporter, partial [Clostridia bacterium]|nr:cation diffusion facilitator family transporter [Clostridia bacterium]
ISPETADYNTVSLIIISVAIAVKLILGQYVKRQGKKHNSGALVASGSDALFDAVLSASVLASAIVYLAWDISLEAYVGVIISAFIVKAGIEMMVDTVNDILGKRSDKEETDRIKNLICEEPEVRGAYDLILFNYGPEKNYASVHVELPDTLSVDDIDKLTRRIETKVYREAGVILTGIGVYSYNTSDDEVAKMRNAVSETVLAHDWALQLHGFYADTGKKTMRFDVVLSFDIDRAEALRILTKEIKELLPDYTLQIVPDIDV